MVIRKCYYLMIVAVITIFSFFIMHNFTILIEADNMDTDNYAPPASSEIILHKEIINPDLRKIETIQSDIKDKVVNLTIRSVADTETIETKLKDNKIVANTTVQKMAETKPIQPKIKDNKVIANTAIQKVSKIEQTHPKSNDNKIVLNATIPKSFKIEPIPPKIKTRDKKLNLVNSKTQKISNNGNTSTPIDLNSLFSCYTIPNYKFLDRRNQYYVIYNFIKAERDFGCMESVTLSAPGDFRFLDNVVALVERWQGPISIALYAADYDFYTTVEAISYLRQCETNLIRDLVSFHIFFDVNYVPTKKYVHLMKVGETTCNCSSPPPWRTVTAENMFKAKKNLLFPINVARNIAKIAAQTYFIFPSDIELYPTVNFIPLFLEFVQSNLKLFASNTKNVFVLPIFEILAGSQVPENKTVLQRMLKRQKAFLFHKNICPMCHRVISGEHWVRAKETKGLHSLVSGKRVGRYAFWEPFFVCTQKEPLWDERLSWEGQGNKIIQAFTLCIMGYNFHILDNAFLIHKPGVKKKKVQMVKFSKQVWKSNRVIRHIAQELKHMYGPTKGCEIQYGYSWVKG